MTPQSEQRELADVEAQLALQAEILTLRELLHASLDAIRETARERDLARAQLRDLRAVLFPHHHQHDDLDDVAA